LGRVHPKFVTFQILYLVRRRNARLAATFFLALRHALKTAVPWWLARARPGTAKLGRPLGWK